MHQISQSMMLNQGLELNLSLLGRKIISGQLSSFRDRSKKMRNSYLNIMGTGGQILMQLFGLKSKMKNAVLI